MSKRKRLTLERVNKILNERDRYSHYLRYKPVGKWDKYDKSNWNSIIKNTKFRRWKK